jgi:hypothetical protein
MKSGQGEPLSKSDNPFLRENLFEPFIRAKRDQANLVRRCKEALKESLKEMRAFCREESELADVPEALWPGKEWLEIFPRILSRLLACTSGVVNNFQLPLEQ